MYVIGFFGHGYVACGLTDPKVIILNGDNLFWRILSGSSKNLIANILFCLYDTTKAKLEMIYWEGEEIRLGKLLDHPEIMT